MDSPLTAVAVAELNSVTQQRGRPGPICCCYRCAFPRDDEATVRQARQRAEAYRAELLGFL